MRSEYSAHDVAELEELVHLLTSWGMKKGEAIEMAVPLVYSGACGERLNVLLSSFGQAPGDTHEEPN